MQGPTREELTAYRLDPKRGREAMERMGILPYFKNLLVHGCLGASFIFVDRRHGLCNPHLLRELTSFHEQLEQTWAGKMIGLILRAKGFADRKQSQAGNARLVIGARAFAEHSHRVSRTPGLGLRSQS